MENGRISKWIQPLKIYKSRCVRSPERAYEHDAGIDFFVPNFIHPIGLFPHQRKQIPSGIHAKIPEGYMLKADDKSGVGIKKGLKYIGGVIDCNYMGEISICLFNTSDEKVMIHAGEKIIQFILIPVLCSPVQVVNSLDQLFPEPTERGHGGFGSTDSFKQEHLCQDFFYSDYTCKQCGSHKQPKELLTHDISGFCYDLKCQDCGYISNE